MSARVGLVVKIETLVCNNIKTGLEIKHNMNTATHVSFRWQVIMYLNLTGSFTSSVMSLMPGISEVPARPSNSGQPRLLRSC